MPGATKMRWFHGDGIQQETENDGQWIGGESKGVSQVQVQKDSKGGVGDQSYQMLLAGW